MTRVWALTVCLAVAGCGSVAKLDAGMSYRQSAAAYKTCLQAAPNPQTCDRERLIMEADERAFTNVAAGYDGGSISANTSSRSR